MAGLVHVKYNQTLRRLFWFVLLWLCGVGGAAMLVLPFRILVRLVMK
jgi:hypothetical protein